MLQEVTIRPIVPGDEAHIRDFFAVMSSESVEFFNRGGENLTRALDFCQKQDTHERIYWMAEWDGKMAGMVFLTDLHTTIPWLGIAVREDLKGRSLGKKLMTFAKDYVLTQGKGGIQLITNLANTRAQRLYEASGFCKIGVHAEYGEWYYLLRFSKTQVK